MKEPTIGSEEAMRVSGMTGRQFYYWVGRLGMRGMGSGYALKLSPDVVKALRDIQRIRRKSEDDIRAVLSRFPDGLSPREAAFHRRRPGVGAVA